ncbi:MAG: transglycosylase domain-containing protein [Deltaproteobacteria bacterium]|nr:transglycosylase domain-containing protein [Deltaproteobacteria bacterium]MBW1736927.1 transglycosylase domain-containing protein [Deltaproteobacteria bacterium]MBW1909578.1 transglycosylase domain-containing protein [Deltaproteobacteria bacterium]MBW2032579.1 transglycosylase domain-containing protein [Deltaproteobacteria bacterium]MBW2114240.1 transglycosylase domain-containing protein [Deltaproteobacteria bacterium]
MFRKKRHIILLILCGLILAPASFLGYTYYRVSRDASTRIQRGAIERVIASESHVYHDDGQTPIGVFFEKTHRKYIYYQEIPKVFMKALIAAEDRNFFNHRGFDLKAMLRAFLANIKAGKVVQGGSTITQQTAKNIFRREKRSYMAKLKELIQAILLEGKYTKQEILEMYANQFFVNGYGKGLRIAAQYFFGKDAKDLDLVEGAFIAGSVKGPNRYNPFIKKSDAEKTKAAQLAKLRKDYVLSNMLKMNFITKDQYIEAKDQDIPFKEGQITYRLNVILDYVREQLESDYFSAILRDQGVENIATSGINVYTSINKEIQEAALRSLRTHLPLIDIKLNGYTPARTADIYHTLLGKGLNKSRDNLPFLSRISHIDTAGENARLVVSWDHGGGIINYEGLQPTGEAWLKWKLGNWAVFDRKHVRAFLKNFTIGDLVPVKLMDSCATNGETKLMLSSVPGLEGSIVVVKEGLIKAMVGGFFNRFFNRAVDAKRQLGSIFKPIVYTAALQLKWNSLDPLQNVRDMFRFENTLYVPRPDHTPKSNKVSMAWAGVKSENLATVWLLYHLTDHLNMNEFRQVMSIVGLDRKEGESYLAYKNRIRDKHGVVINKQALTEAAFEKSKKEVESDIIFSGHEEILSNLNRLHFTMDEKKLSIEAPEEQQILRFSFKRLNKLNLKMKAASQGIESLLEQYALNKNAEVRKRLSLSLRHFYRNDRKYHRAEIIYLEEVVHPSTIPLLPLTPEWILKGPTSLPIKEVLIDGLITSGVLDLIQKNMKKNYNRLVSHKRYDPEVLFRVRDFRTLVNLSYVVHVAKKMGIFTKLDPVLSFPLGPNSISIVEAALAYQTIMTGQVFPISPEGDPAHIPIITKIVDREGEILWEYRPAPKKVLSDRLSKLVTEILMKVMETGTGRTAKDAVQLVLEEEGESIRVPIPSFGKTGTANRFTNSSFVGFIPGPNKETGQLDIHKGYVIASYVGYDDNRPMKGKHLAIYGATGALPLWTDTANAIVNTQGYKKDLQPADLVFNPLPAQFLENEEFRTVPISLLTGLPLNTSKEASDSSPSTGILAEVEDYGEKWRLLRRFEPAGKN